MSDETRWRRSSKCVGDEHCVEVAASETVKARNKLLKAAGRIDNTEGTTE